MVKAEQTEIPGTERKRIPAIERAASKADDKRAIINGLQGELINLVAKLSEAMHAKESELDIQENSKGEREIIYKRGDYSCKVKYKETVNYKVKKESRGDEPDGEGSDDDE